ncbi:MAG TPA: serine/threonine-protein kinase [Kofleriaceae bacterium]
MTSDSGTGSSTGGTSRHDQLRESSELAAEMRRFGAVCLYGMFAWVLLGGMGVYLAVSVYDAPWEIVVMSRCVGFVPLAVGYYCGRRGTPTTVHGVTLMSAWVAATSGFLIGLEGAYFGGVYSPYGVGACFCLVGVATMQRNMRVAWPAFLITAFAYDAGLVASPAHVLSHMTRVDWFGLGISLVLFVGLMVFCGLLSHFAWTVRMQLFESRNIGRYKLQKRLGRGGMGEVWRAFHQTLGRDVAVKILRPEKIDDDAVARFEREVRATTALTHPNTVRVFDYGMTEDGLWYYAMELLEGVSFAQLVKQSGAQNAPRTVHLVSQASRALGEAHRAGIVHRDVKPDNLIICQAGGEHDFVKVIDFGIARSLGDENVTRIGEVAGTPSYMAPEVASSMGFDARADVYSLGAVLYYLLTGSPPFVAEDPALLLAAHRNEPVVPPSLRAPAPVDADLEAIVLKCLAKKDKDRYADGAELAEALATTVAFGAPRSFTTDVIPVANVDPADVTATDKRR